MYTNIKYDNDRINMSAKSLMVLLSRISLLITSSRLKIEQISIVRIKTKKVKKHYSATIYLRK